MTRTQDARLRLRSLSVIFIVKFFFMFIMNIHREEEGKKISGSYFFGIFFSAMIFIIVFMHREY